MKNSFIFLLGCVLFFAAVFTGLWSWPAYREREKISSGVRAAERGAELAFNQNLYREKTGAYTDNFARLFAALGQEAPCPLDDSQTVLACADYHYRVRGAVLYGFSVKDPSVFFSFDLINGVTDCSRALAQAQRAEVCSALE